MDFVTIRADIDRKHYRQGLYGGAAEGTSIEVQEIRRWGNTRDDLMFAMTYSWGRYCRWDGCVGI